MLPMVKVGEKSIGVGQPVYIIAEIGINHNGDLELAKQLIAIAARSGCDAVKFQKRTPELLCSVGTTKPDARDPLGVHQLYGLPAPCGV